MVKRILTTIAGMVIGLICGAILGVLIGGVTDLIIGHWFGWRWLFGGVIGLATGLISGAGTGLLGVRTRYGLEWLFFIFAGVPIGFMLMEHPLNWNAWSNLLVLTGIGALAGWLSVLIVRAAFGKKVSGEPFQYWMTAGYLALFAALIFMVPRFLQFLGRAISP